jgi:hypothetical protein
MNIHWRGFFAFPFQFLRQALPGNFHSPPLPRWPYLD